MLQLREIMNLRFGFTAVYCIALLLLIWISQPALLSNLHSQWTTSGELDFGYLVLAMAVAVVLMQLKDLPAPTWRLEFRYLVPATAGVFVAFCGLWINTQSILIIGLVILWWSLTMALLGTRAFGKTTIAALMILASTPLIFVLIPALRAMTVFAVTHAVNAVGILAFIEGNLIHMSTGVIEIADGCSGTKYFHTSVVLGLVAQGFGLSRQPVVKVFALLLTAAIVANWVRVFILVAWAYNTSVTHPLILDHDWLGWVVFALFMFYPLQYLTKEVAKPSVSPSLVGDRTLNPAKLAALAVCAIAFMMAPSLLNQSLDQRLTWSQVAMPTLTSARAQGCSMVAREDDWQPHFEGADRLEVKAARCGPLKVDYAMVQYLKESQGKELIYWNNGPFDEALWRTKVRPNATFADGSPARVLEATHVATGSKRLAMYQYRVGSYQTVSGLQTKILGLLRLFDGVPAPRAAIIAIDCRADCLDEREALDARIALEEA